MMRCARVTSASGGLKTVLAMAIWLGWIAHFPSNPRAAARSAAADIAIRICEIAKGAVQRAQTIGTAGDDHARQ
jgi:hypothetical protein